MDSDSVATVRIWRELIVEDSTDLEEEVEAVLEKSPSILGAISFPLRTPHTEKGQTKK